MRELHWWKILSLRNIIFLNDNHSETHDVLWIEDGNVVGTVGRMFFHEQHPMHRLPSFDERQILSFGFELLHNAVGIVIVGPFALTYQYVLLVDGLSHDIQLHHPSIWSVLGKDLSPPSGGHIVSYAAYDVATDKLAAK